MRTMRAPDSEAKSLFINCKAKENSCFTHTHIKPVTAGTHTLKQSCRKMHEEHANLPQNFLTGTKTACHRHSVVIPVHAQATPTHKQTMNHLEVQGERMRETERTRKLYFTRIVV